uniref:Suckerin-4 n=1 Tax=Sepioteuthis lessoniana TaxID=34570 RepID=A0A081DU94_SEPLE
MTATVLFLLFGIAALTCQTEAAITGTSSVKTVVHPPTVVHPVHTVTHTDHHPLVWNTGPVYGIPSAGSTSVKTVTHGIHHTGGISVTSPGGATVTHTTHGISHPFGLGHGLGGLYGGVYGLPMPGATTVSHSTHGVPYSFGYGGLGYGGIGYGGLGYGGLGYGLGGAYGLPYPNTAISHSSYGFQSPSVYGFGFGGPYGFH